MIGEEPDAFGRRPERGGDVGFLFERMERRQPIAAGGCDGKAGEHRHDAIELEGPQRAGIHGMVSVPCGVSPLYNPGRSQP